MEIRNKTTLAFIAYVLMFSCANPVAAQDAGIMMLEDFNDIENSEFLAEFLGENSDLADYRQSTYPWRDEDVDEDDPFEDIVVLAQATEPVTTFPETAGHPCRARWNNAYARQIERFNARNGLARVINDQYELREIDGPITLWMQCEFFGNCDQSTLNIFETLFIPRLEDVPDFNRMTVAECEALADAAEETNSAFFEPHFKAGFTALYQVGQIPLPGGPISSAALCKDYPGCLWKPKADSNVGAVILLPISLKGVSYTAVDGKGEQLRQIRESCCANGNRQHYWFSKPGSSYTGPITFTFNNGESIKVTDPSKREE